MAGLHTIGPAEGCPEIFGPSARPALAHRGQEAAALLQPEDLAGARTVLAPAHVEPHLRPPRPGRPGVYRSAALSRVDRTLAAAYPVGERWTVLLEHVTAYRGLGAADYLHELRQELSGDRGWAEPGRRWVAVDEDIAGDESLLVRLRETAGGGRLVHLRTRYLVVARTGGAVLVLADLGWDDGDGREALVRQLAAPAVWRARTLR